LDNPTVIEARGLVKRYGDIEAVRGLDLDVHAGETFGFLGPNGAGKSTTIKILCTLATPTEGEARVAGFDVVHERAAVRRNIGLVFQDPTLDTYLSAARNLRFHGELYGMQRAAIAERSQLVLEMVGLWERRDARVATFSGGMKRRLEIARGLLHSPSVLFLDEPTVGLDPQTRLSIWNYLRELRSREAVTIFLTTHYMDEAENCDRIAIVNEGRIIALDTPDALKASVGTDRVQITTADDEAAVASLAELFEITAERRDGQLTFHVPDGEHFVPRLFAELAVPIRSVSVSRPSLDDVFLAYTGTTIRDAEASAADGVRAFARARG
jgi:ABC-2 type transport system ATP-binding protein